MAVRVVARNSFSQPDDAFYPEKSLEAVLDFLTGHLRISIRMEKATLGGEQQTTDGHVDRASVEDHPSVHDRNSEYGGHLRPRLVGEHVGRALASPAL